MATSGFGPTSGSMQVTRRRRLHLHVFALLLHYRVGGSIEVRQTMTKKQAKQVELEAWLKNMHAARIVTS